MEMARSLRIDSACDPAAAKARYRAEGYEVASRFLALVSHLGIADFADPNNHARLHAIGKNFWKHLEATHGLPYADSSARDKYPRFDEAFGLHLLMVLPNYDEWTFLMRFLSEMMIAQPSFEVACRKNPETFRETQRAFIASLIEISRELNLTIREGCRVASACEAIWPFEFLRLHERSKGSPFPFYRAFFHVMAFAEGVGPYTDSERMFRGFKAVSASWLRNYPTISEFRLLEPLEYVHECIAALMSGRIPWNSTLTFEALVYGMLKHRYRDAINKFRFEVKPQCKRGSLADTGQSDSESKPVRKFVNRFEPLPEDEGKLGALLGTAVIDEMQDERRRFNERAQEFVAELRKGAPHLIPFLCRMVELKRQGERAVNKTLAKEFNLTDDGVNKRVKRMRTVWSSVP